MKKNPTLWAFIVLPILVITIFVLLVQNIYLKGANDYMRQQLTEVQQQLDKTERQLNEIIRKQQENGDKIDNLGDGDNSNVITPAPTAQPQSTTNSNPPHTSRDATPAARPSQAPRETASQPAPSRQDPSANPSLLCNPVLPLIC